MPYSIVSCLLLLLLGSSLTTAAAGGREAAEGAKARGSSKSKSNSPVQLIIDTDMDFDVDDVGAVCVANAMADRGEAELLAVVHDMGYPRGVAAPSVLNHYYGRDSVPLGAFKGKFGEDINGKYVDDLVEHWPSPVKNYTQVEEAVTIYRKVLAAADDRSVVISSIGFLTNIANLLASKPDNYSSLSGYDLVAAKVRLVAVMGGFYPQTTTTGEFNFNCGKGLMGQPYECEGKSREAVSGMPPSVKMVFSGGEVGSQVNSGGALTTCAPESNPCRQAYIDLCGYGNDRLSWDPLTTIYAVRGADAVSCSDEGGAGGKNDVSADGTNKWVPGDSSNQSYLIMLDPSAPGKAIDELLCATPKNPQPPPVPPPTAKWDKHAGDNCYGIRSGSSRTHGAEDLEVPPEASCGVMSISDCQRRCDDRPGCTAVTVSKATGDQYNCFRKADVNLDECDHNTEFDTWTRE